MKRTSRHQIIRTNTNFFCLFQIRSSEDSSEALLETLDIPYVWCCMCAHILAFFLKKKCIFRFLWKKNKWYAQTQLSDAKVHIHIPKAIYEYAIFTEKNNFIVIKCIGTYVFKWSCGFVQAAPATCAWNLTKSCVVDPLNFLFDASAEEHAQPYQVSCPFLFWVVTTFPIIFMFTQDLHHIANFPSGHRCHLHFLLCVSAVPVLGPLSVLLVLWRMARADDECVWHCVQVGAST